MRGRRGRGRGYYGGGGGGGYGGGYYGEGYGGVGFPNYNNDSTDGDFRQYISQRVKDVSVACYIGRDCAIRDYSSFSVNRIYRKEAPIAAPPHLLPSLVPKGTKIPEGLSAHVTVKLRGVNCDQYYTKTGEKETYKILH